MKSFSEYLELDICRDGAHRNNTLPLVEAELPVDLYLFYP